MKISSESLHVSIQLDLPYEEFVARLEMAAGRFQLSVLEENIDNPILARQMVAEMEGEGDLMIFSVLDHGLALRLYGVEQKARLYEIGNPLTAGSMTRLNIEAALYAPMRVLVYESPDRVALVKYDQPSSLFSQFGDSEITRVGLDLDTKLLQLLAFADNRDASDL